LVLLLCSRVEDNIVEIEATLAMRNFTDGNPLIFDGLPREDVGHDWRRLTPAFCFTNNRKFKLSRGYSVPGHRSKS
jgi:hypothetical protein